LALLICALTGAIDAGFVVIVGAFVMVNVMGMVCELAAPGDEITICPVYVPACNPVPFTLTVSVAGVVMPLEGLTNSQFEPWLTLAMAVNVIAPAELDTVRF
jgi:hypothetical protein